VLFGHLPRPYAPIGQPIEHDAKFGGLRTRNSRQAGQLSDDCGQGVKSG
jgi:hypothetical protein